MYLCNTKLDMWIGCGFHVEMVEMQKISSIVVKQLTSATRIFLFLTKPSDFE